MRMRGRIFKRRTTMSGRQTGAIYKPLGAIAANCESSLRRPSPLSDHDKTDENIVDGAPREGEQDGRHGHVPRLKGA
jgi:hypothetical protein